MKSFKKAIAVLMVVATLMSLPVSASAEWKLKSGKKEETTAAAEAAVAAAPAAAAAPADAAAPAEAAAPADATAPAAETAKRKTLKEKIADKKAAKAAEKAAKEAAKAAEKAAKEAAAAATAAETTEAQKVNKRENVATMYLIYTSANKLEPHFWIYIVNNTDETLMVGPYALEPHGTVSIGSWDDRGMGKGIHFNLERYWVKEETYGRAFSIKTSVNRKELEKLGSKFKRHNYWNWGFNCVWFATCMWNSCTIKFVPFLFSPRFSLAFMFLYGAKRPDYTIQKLNSASKCYKYQDDGTLKPVVPGVLFTNYGV